MNSISSRFSKCKFLKAEHGEKVNRGGGPGDAKDKPKNVKPHHNVALIEQITMMGFLPGDAKKALKLTHGEVNQAVTLLLGGTEALENVSDSEEEDANQKAEEMAKKAKEEELAKLAEEKKQVRRTKRVSFADFELYLTKA